MAKLKSITDGSFFRSVPARYRLIAIFGLLLLLTACFIIPTFIGYRITEQKNMKNVSSMNLSPADLMYDSATLPQLDQINVYITTSSIDLDNMEMNVFVSFIPTGVFASKDPADAPGALSVLNTIRVVVGDISEEFFSSGDIMKPLSVSLPLLSGDVNSFPFDKYDSKTSVTIQYENERDVEIPMGIYADGFTQNFNVFPQILPIVNGIFRHAYIRYVVTRSSSVIGFSIFLVVLMWFLSLSTLALSLDVIMRKKPPAEGLMGMAIALIFALPALREAVPGVPKFGAVIDVLGFFWNMAFVGFSAVMLMGWYIIREFGIERAEEARGKQLAIDEEAARNEATSSSFGI
eukprot:Partr_v1_DN25917_c0_g1_i2_m68779